LASRKIEEVNTSFKFFVSKNIFVYENKHVEFEESPLIFHFLNFAPRSYKRTFNNFLTTKIFHTCAHLQKRDVWFSFFVTYIEKNQKRDFASFE